MRSLFLSDNMQNSTRFVPSLEKATWMNAQNYCRSKYRDLAIVRDSAENAQIASMIQSKNFWIGLYRDSWKWVDGSPLTFEKWGPSSPNSLYGDICAATVNGVWLNLKCGGGLPYACSKGELPSLLLLFHQLPKRDLVTVLSDSVLVGSEPGKKVTVMKVVLRKTDPSVSLEDLNILHQVMN